MDDDRSCCPDAAPAPRGVAGRRRAARVFRALGDPTRLEILALIAARPEPICVCDIVSRFELSQPTISHHLRILREAGLVTASRRGTWSYYQVHDRGAAVLRSAVRSAIPEAATAGS